MQHLTPIDPETQSLNGLDENITRLKDLFPEAFSEGKLNFDTLRELLAGEIDDQPEKYGLNWNGKARARRHALTPTRATLRPDKASSVDWDTTQNLMIEGDNLEVLKLLQRSYAGKVKLIYIDPPYNTGKDFVYPDNYTDSLKNYQELTGQTEEGRRVSSNTESSGRFHTDWLNMMYPRLKLARELLREDGVIIVSIDENEHTNLMQVLNDVFGIENFSGEIIWKNSSKNDQDFISFQHEYIIFFSKNKKLNGGNWVEKKSGLDEIYKIFKSLRVKYGNDWQSIHDDAVKWFKQFPDSNPITDSKHYSWMDERGVYFASDISGPNFGQYRYDVAHPLTGKVCKEPASGWRYPEETMRQRIREGLVHFGTDHTTVPNNKTYLSDTEFQSLTSIKFQDGRAASKRLDELFGEKVFTNPKDEYLLLDLFKAMNVGNGDIILDFFAGSGTTFHSTLLLNQVSDVNCVSISVQLPENLHNLEASSSGSAKRAVSNAIQLLKNKKYPENVAELTKERLRRAGAKVKSENPMFSGDTGFRVFKLDSSNIAAWDEATARADLVGTLQFAEKNIKPDRDEWDVLYEVLLKLGLPLTTPVEERAIAGHTVQLVGGGALMACLSRTIAAADVQALGRGMADWLLEQDAAGDSHLLFLDSAFADDAAKLNLSTYLEQRAKTAEPKRTWVVRSI